MAVIVRPYSESDGNLAYASSINKVIDDLYTLQNGNINSANVATSAIGTTQLDASAVTTAKLKDLAVTVNKLDYETTIFNQEVF